MCEIVFQLPLEFYYRLSLILEQKYRDTDKSITRGIFFIAINDNEKLITIKYRDDAQHCIIIYNFYGVHFWNVKNIMSLNTGHNKIILSWHWTNTQLFILDMSWIALSFQDFSVFTEWKRQVPFKIRNSCKSTVHSTYAKEEEKWKRKKKEGL